MSIPIDHTELHRTAKYFMDNGRASTHEEAIAILKSFGLVVHVGPELATSALHQAALLTLVNLARRTLLNGVHVCGIPKGAACVSKLSRASSLADAVTELGGTITSSPPADWPQAMIGSAATAIRPAWRVTWEGWRGGVVMAGHPAKLDETSGMELAPMLAAAVCAAEAFAFCAGDHLLAGRRAHGLSLWRPGQDWLISDHSEPRLAYLPSSLWIIGLGNLGQAFAWLLSALPYCEPQKATLVLQDFDRIAASNDSTSPLSFRKDIGRRKGRVVSDWLEERGFQTFVEERRFGGWIRRSPDEPRVALCGVDNALARTALEEAGFDLVVEAGLGAGPEAFRSLAVHTFPATRTAKEIWSRQISDRAVSPESMPAYQQLKKAGMDACGLAQLASRTVGVPFVGLIAGCLAVSELLRRLHGGIALEYAAGSVFALDDIECGSIEAEVYAFGHLPRT
ncbi:thiamine biosynthesis protein ThiF [Bradyrhizobium nitroreducens]|uniref:thiamine biosynthesis protein ThiF n=1 Tax=Bradyrhizobium nitroreducens TaxID=709803 RepID=UPI000C1EEF58|nr:thiamine biosynthesis protein ThiF [Bradyrhizobium nitroreducens]